MPTSGSDPLRPERSRSVGFLEHDGLRWACSLVTYRAGAHRWKGYIRFREAEGIREVRTAELFLESSEGEIDRRARALGLPMISALLDSALEVEARRRAERPSSHWVRALLEKAVPDSADGSDRLPEEIALRSRYASYRNEQVGHLIALLSPEDFDRVVEQVLAGRKVKFGGRDRLQFALAVVDHLESLLPLPPFEVWRDDFTAHRADYERYSEALREGDELPE